MAIFLLGLTSSLITEAEMTDITHHAMGRAVAKAPHVLGGKFGVWLTVSSARVCMCVQSWAVVRCYESESWLGLFFILLFQQLT